MCKILQAKKNTNASKNQRNKDTWEVKDRSKREQKKQNHNNKKGKVQDFSTNIV